MHQLTFNPYQLKKRLLGVGLYHWYSQMTNRLAILPKVKIVHDPDAPAQGRVVSNVWRKLRKPRPAWIVYLE